MTQESLQHPTFPGGKQLRNQTEGAGHPLNGSKLRLDELGTAIEREYRSKKPGHLSQEKGGPQVCLLALSIDPVSEDRRTPEGNHAS